MKNKVFLSLLLSATMVAGLSAVVKPAQAAFPGTNGKVAFVTYDPHDGNSDIYTMNPDGSKPTRLTSSSADETEPAWSPDGTKITFRRDFDIYVMNPDGSEQERLTEDPGADLEPAWSPDGTQITFVSSRDGNYDIYVMSADGSEQTNLTDGTASDYSPPDYSPAWSPDGTKIAFYRNGDIYVMNPDGSEQKKLTEDPGADLEPAWSPDSTKIAFVTDRNVERPPSRGQPPLYDIYTMNPDGSEQTNLTNANESADGVDPAWSPDGSKIVFHSSRDGEEDVYTMNPNGSGQSKLPNDPVEGIESMLDWGVAAPKMVDSAAPRGTVLINGGAARTGKSTVRLTLSARDPKSSSDI